MNLRTLLLFLKYPKLSGIWVPFKRYHKSHVHIGKNCQVILKGRLKLGNEKKLPAVSQAPVNLWFGENSFISFGKSVCIGPGVNIIIKENSKLLVGNNTFFTSDMHIEGSSLIEIGNDCAISWGVTIIDDNHHEIISDASNSSKIDSGKVIIGDKVWLTNNVVVLKNTTIGSNSVVTPNSVVKGTYPPNSLIGGNPAKIIKQISGWIK